MTAARLAELLEERGARFEQLVGEYQRTRLPSFQAGGGIRSREDSAASKQQRQLERDCEGVGQSLKMVNDVMADMIERILRVTNTDKGGAICIRCGRRIDPKTETVKWWKSRDAVHPSCYVALWRAEQKAS